MNFKWVKNTLEIIFWRNYLVVSITIFNSKINDNFEQYKRDGIDPKYFKCKKSCSILCLLNNLVSNYACLFEKFFFVRDWISKIFNDTNGLIYLWIPRMSLIFEYVNWADLTGIRDTCVMGSATFPIRFSQTFVKLRCL